MGGPFIVIPVSALDAWHGCTQTGAMAGDATAPDDYDRACAVDEPAGVIGVGENGAQALVPADQPATSCHLPERRVWLRWLTVDSEAGLKAAAEAVLADPATEWEECGLWVSQDLGQLAVVLDVLVEKRGVAVPRPLLGVASYRGQDHRGFGSREVVTAVVRVIERWLQHGGYLAP